MSPASPTPTSSSDKMEDASMVTPDGGGSNSAFLNEAVKEPSENDVLCGRGGSINSHPGNERFRNLVEKRKRVYLTARFKREKRLIASSIVSEIRALNPPGRFLLKDSKTGLWKDIGDEKARDKTSQALRENAPSIRAEIETEINEQRAEMQREEEASRPPPPPPPPGQSYYSSGWGYQSYYGYSHSAPPPPPPPGHAGYPPPHEGHWGSHPPPPPPYYYGDHAHYRPPPPPQKSVVERTAEYVASGAESIKSWTRNSFGGSILSASSHDSRSASSMNSKPLAYVHEGSSRKRRVVKFRDESGSQRRSRPCYSPINGGGATVSSNSLIDGTGEELQVIEPQHLDAAPDDQSSSLMTQFANQVLGSIGSWDAGTICGYADGDDEKVPFPELNPSSAGAVAAAAAAPMADDEQMEVEWEGQEVQLVSDRAEQDSVASDERMPPPVLRPKRTHDQDSSIAFSSLGSCHSWIPEQFGSAASFFSGSRNAAPSGVASVPSMDMEYSATGGTENYSAAGSINFSAAGSVGGNSLSRVFEHEAHDYSMSSPTHMNHRELSQMPSWERSLRSRSPLSIGSEDDDASLVSKSSSKVSEGQLSSSHTTPQHGNGMAWE